MIKHLTHKIRLKPTIDQEIYFRKACGVSRFSYNWALAEWKKRHELGEKTGHFAIHKELTKIKKDTFPWMYEVSKTASQYAIYDNLNTAFKKFFKEGSGYPKFKKKGIRDTFRADDGSGLKIEGKKVRVPKLGMVEMYEEFRFKGRVRKCVVSRTADRWFISIGVEFDINEPVCENQDTVGVDIGIKTLATLSDGTTFDNPRSFVNKQKKLRRLQQELSRKKKGSTNRQKAKMKVARCYMKIRDLRQYHIHNLTSHIVKNFGTITIEDLAVTNMVKNRKLSKHILDAGFYEFRRQLEYKVQLNGNKLRVVDRFFPSSKLCSNCGNKKENLTLDKRIYKCNHCGVKVDRDLNAAINLKQNCG